MCVCMHVCCVQHRRRRRPLQNWFSHINCKLALRNAHGSPSHTPPHFTQHIYICVCVYMCGVLVCLRAMSAHGPGQTTLAYGALRIASPHRRRRRRHHHGENICFCSIRGVAGRFGLSAFPQSACERPAIGISVS